MKIIDILFIVLLCLTIAGLAGQSGSQAVAASSHGDNLTQITNFTVSPYVISAGSKATLSWQTSNAISASIVPGLGAVPVSGQVDVSPASSTIYKITATGSAGTRSAYTTLYVNTSGSGSGSEVGSDPVTGRNAQVDFAWKNYWDSRQYQVQIARDPDFTLKVFDSGAMDTSDSASPAFWMPPGTLEAGHTYYWRVRSLQAATGQYVDSPWSDIKTFTVEPGYIGGIAYSVQAFAPANGSTDYPVKPLAFSWSVYQGATKYQFVLATDAELRDIVVDDFTSTTSYTVKDPLVYDTVYYWQVRAVEPVLSDAGAVFTFHTVKAPQRAQEDKSDIFSAVSPWVLAVELGGILVLSILVIVLFRVFKKA